MKHGNREGLKQGLGLAVILGAIFLGLQGYEYGHAAFGFREGNYPTIFFMATGFHGFHVFVGACFLTVTSSAPLRAISPEGTCRVRSRCLVLALCRCGLDIPVRVGLLVGFDRQPARRRRLSRSGTFKGKRRRANRRRFVCAHGRSTTTRP